MALEIIIYYNLLLTILFKHLWEKNYIQQQKKSNNRKKAAALCYGLVNNHAFHDGNKRIGVLAMLTFLELNSIIINCSDEEIINLVNDQAYYTY